ncbi:MAG TPA: transcriptional repressor, partial [Chloroflexota bacterium]|nr:transcriptional repressor [Chloroflexota bacterium]
MSHVQRDFAGQIRQMGYRMTPQRQMVLDVLCTQGGHMAAPEVVTAVQLHSPFLNRATVYRALDFLCELQLVTRTEIGGQIVYELAEERPHHHLVCRVCGHAQEWDGRALDTVA